MFDMFNMLGKLGEVKDKMAEVKEKLPFIELEEYSEDYLVKVKVTADKKIKHIEIRDQLLTPEAKEDLEEKVRMVINAAMVKAGARAREEYKQHLEDSLPNIPGLDLDNLPF